jgi:hypothetical protein
MNSGKVAWDTDSTRVIRRLYYPESSPRPACTPGSGGFLSNPRGGPVARWLISAQSRMSRGERPRQVTCEPAGGRREQWVRNGRKSR